MTGKFGLVGKHDKWKKGDPPGNQTVNIIINSHTSLKDGSICISSDLIDDVEVDECINALVNDLEKVRKAAKRNIAKVNSKIRSGR